MEPNLRVREVGVSGGGGCEVGLQVTVDQTDFVEIFPLSFRCQRREEVKRERNVGGLRAGEVNIDPSFWPINDDLDIVSICRQISATNLNGRGGEVLRDRQHEVRDAGVNIL
jgi:hypothetical protein